MVRYTKGKSEGRMSLTSQDKQDIQSIVAEVISTTIDGFAISINQSFQGITTQILGVENGLDSLEGKVDRIDTRLEILENKVDTIDRKLDSSITRLDDHGLRLTRLELATFK